MVFTIEPMINVGDYHLYIDEDIRNKRNPFKNNNWVDLYKEETEQEERIGSIVMEEIKLIA